MNRNEQKRKLTRPDTTVRPLGRHPNILCAPSLATSLPLHSHTMVNLHPLTHYLATPLLPSILPGPLVVLSDYETASPPPLPFLRTHKVISRIHCSTITPPPTKCISTLLHTTIPPPNGCSLRYCRSQKTERSREKRHLHRLNTVRVPS